MQYTIVRPIIYCGLRFLEATLIRLHGFRLLVGTRNDGGREDCDGICWRREGGGGLYFSCREGITLHHTSMVAAATRLMSTGAQYQH
jgi:hypothetical protein